MRAMHSEVKLRVRQSALLLREFTISQLVRVTGLNPESVRTEVQRLKREGNVVSGRQAGLRERLYRLCDDPEKRLALSRSVETFYPSPPEPQVPTSHHYERALRILDRAETAKGAEREELLRQAEHWLEGAWQSEGASRAPASVQAHIQREQGRLAYLRGDLSRAEAWLQQAREKFVVGNQPGEVRLVDEYLLCVESWRQVIARSDVVDVRERARCVLEAVEGSSIGPLARLFANVVRGVLASAESRVVEAAFEQDVASMRREVHDMRREVHEIQTEFRSEREPLHGVPPERPEYAAPPLSWGQSPHEITVHLPVQRQGRAKPDVETNSRN
jgi:hypothetical protein